MIRWLMLLFLLGCGNALAAATVPNVIIITLDTTRADRMGFLGAQQGLTPNLDMLASGTRLPFQDPGTVLE